MLRRSCVGFKVWHPRPLPYTITLQLDCVRPFTPYAHPQTHPRGQPLPRPWSAYSPRNTRVWACCRDLEASAIFRSNGTTLHISRLSPSPPNAQRTTHTHRHRKPYTDTIHTHKYNTLTHSCPRVLPLAHTHAHTRTRTRVYAHS